MLNAEATQGRGLIEVVLRPADGGVCIEGHDNGPGVPKERRPKLFESLATTKEAGTGLGRSRCAHVPRD